MIQGITSCRCLTQLLSSAAQRLIAELRRAKGRCIVGIACRSPVLRLEQACMLALLRIMRDVEGVRNLIGTGLVEFVGGLPAAGPMAWSF